MSNHKEVQDDEEFTTLLNSSQNKLLVVDYNATWCGPCLKIAPVFLQLAHKYPQALFLGVDVDKCRETAMSQGISAMPTFILYRNRQKLDSLRGANGAELEEKIKRHYGTGDVSADPHGTGTGGFTDIFPYVEMKGCECLNESDSTPFRAFLEGKSHLISDCDEQLIMHYGFSQNIKLQSFKIKAPLEKGPKKVKFFINQPKTLDFDAATSMEGVQEFELSEADLSGETPVELRFVKFQNVSNLQVFVADNHGGEEQTVIEKLTFYGVPVNTTNMGDFKRIAGNKGESH